MIIPLVSTTKKQVKLKPVSNIMKLINFSLKRGLKLKSMNLILKALTEVKKLSKLNPFLELELVLKKIKCFVELKSLKIGSANYLVPFLITETKQLFIGIIYY